ncbi:MAG: cold-shock protein, partial [Alphaproteobacteria bacterium]
FIEPSAGGQDVFVHISEVQRSGLSGLNDGQAISYELKVDSARGKTSAVNLQIEQ